MPPFWGLPSNQQHISSPQVFPFWQTPFFCSTETCRFCSSLLWNTKITVLWKAQKKRLYWEANPLVSLRSSTNLCYENTKERKGKLGSHPFLGDTIEPIFGSYRIFIKYTFPNMNHLQLDPPKYRVHPNLLLQLSITLFGCLGPQTFASSSSFKSAPFFLQPPTKMLNKNLRENQELFFYIIGGKNLSTYSENVSWGWTLTKHWNFRGTHLIHCQ